MQTSQLHVDPWEGDGKMNSGNHLHAHEGKKNHQNSQYELNQGKTCLTNVINFSDEMTGLVDKGGRVDVI